MPKNAEELNKENTLFRIAFGKIIEKCNKEIVFAEVAGSDLRKTFAEEMKLIAQKQLKGSHK